MCDDTPFAAAPLLMPIQTALPPLTPMQTDILDALRPAGIELIAKEIATRAGYRYSSRLRTVLRGMLLHRLLERGAHGYRLPAISVRDSAGL